MSTETVHRRCPTIIKGCPRDRWEEVQLIQDQPFIYISGNGSKWAGDEEDDIDKLYEMLERYSLDPRFGNTPESYWTDNPCEGIRNPEWTPGDSSENKWIDGDPLYRVEVTSFFGNFLYYSHGFSIDTNHKKTINRLKSLISENLRKIATGERFDGDENSKESEARLFSRSNIESAAESASKNEVVPDLDLFAE